MSLRTISTGIPRTSIDFCLVFTLFLDDFEDRIDYGIIRKHGLDSAAHLAFLESVAAPSGLLHIADGFIDTDGTIDSRVDARSSSDCCLQLFLRQLAQVVIERPKRSSIDWPRIRGVDFRLGR